MRCNVLNGLSLDGEDGQAPDVARPSLPADALPFGETVSESLGLHESAASREVQIVDVSGYETASFGFAPNHAAGRAVILDGHVPVGVVPNEEEMFFEEAGFGFGFTSPLRRTRRSSRRAAAELMAAAEGAALPEPEKARHFFRSQMPKEAVLGQVTTVEVSIARKLLDLAAGQIGDTAGADVDMERKIIVQVIPPGTSISSTMVAGGSSVGSILIRFR